jgi:hypothetical protein
MQLNIARLGASMTIPVFYTISDDFTPLRGSIRELPGQIHASPAKDYTVVILHQGLPADQPRRSGRL